MKKTITIFTAIAILFMVTFVPVSYAAALDTIDIDVNKTTVRPGEEVILNINFGQNLGAYTFTVDFDDDIFEHVSVEGGEAHVTGDELKVVFHDTTRWNKPKKQYERYL